jgi:hypothetical protein
MSVKADDSYAKCMLRTELTSRRAFKASANEICNMMNIRSLCVNQNGWAPAARDTSQLLIRRVDRQ